MLDTPVDLTPTLLFLWTLAEWTLRNRLALGK